MTKSDLSVAFTHWGVDIDKTGEEAATQGSAATEAEGKTCPFFFCTMMVILFANNRKITIITSAF